MKKIAVTMGEPGGVGPEVALKAIKALRGRFIPIVVADASVMEEAAGTLPSPPELRIIKSPGEARPGAANILDSCRARGFKKGKPTKAGGRASADSIKKALSLVLKKDADALVTAPISKEALRMAGLKWPGHTEMLASLTGTKDYAMMLMGGPLRVMLVTTHVALRDVPGLITPEAVSKTIRLALRACEMLSINEPRIAVSALNPHAGEGGLMGNEEINIIGPAVEAAKNKGLPVYGPYPPDTLYHRAYKGEFDIVVSMYHDQGLVPLKLVAFEKSVNVTVGLPVIRISPGHGTAYGIAWTGQANPSSMMEAIKTALRLKSV